MSRGDVRARNTAPTWDDRSVADVPDTSTGNVRLTELLGVLSLGTDLGMGHPMEHAIRQSLLAVRLGEHAGLDEQQQGVVYYSSLVAWVGCHVDAYEQAKWFGDDRVFKADAREVDLGRSVETTAYLLRHLAAGEAAAARARLGVRFLGEGIESLTSMFGNHWRAADFDSMEDADAEALTLNQSGWPGSDTRYFVKVLHQCSPRSSAITD